MADYHTTYKGPEGATTEWDDIQAKLGNYVPKPKPKPKPFEPPEQKARRQGVPGLRWGQQLGRQQLGRREHGRQRAVVTLPLLRRCTTLALCNVASAGAKRHRVAGRQRRG